MKNIYPFATCILLLILHSAITFSSENLPSVPERSIRLAGVGSGLSLLIIAGLLYGCWKLFRSFKDQ